MMYLYVIEWRDGDVCPGDTSPVCSPCQQGAYPNHQLREIECTAESEAWVPGHPWLAHNPQGPSLFSLPARLGWLQPIVEGGLNRRHAYTLSKVQNCICRKYRLLLSPRLGTRPIYLLGSLEAPRIGHRPNLTAGFFTCCASSVPTVMER